MKWNIWIRQVHRWLSIVFAMGVVTYMGAMAWGRPADWVGLLALLPLIVLLLTGLYLFLLPYTGRPRVEPGRKSALRS